MVGILSVRVDVTLPSRGMVRLPPKAFVLLGEWAQWVESLALRTVCRVGLCVWGRRT